MNATGSRNNRYSNDNDGLNSDEEEEERHLSEQHGEAADDASPSKRKRGSSGGGRQQNTRLTEEDAAAAAEFEEKIVRKKPRPVLTPAELKGEGGLILVRRSFPSTVKKFRDVPPAKRRRASGVSPGTARSDGLARRAEESGRIDAAARYSRSLVGAYREFAHGLFPSLAAEDVFLKIEDLGSKREVKDYMQVMRDDFRKEYLEGIYGKDKAGRILTELRYGLSAARHAHPTEEENYGGGNLRSGDGGNAAPRIGHAVNEDGTMVETAPQAYTPRKRAVVVNPYAKKAHESEDAAPEDTGPEEEGGKKTDGSAAAVAGSPKGGSDDGEEEASFSTNGEDGGNAGSEADKADEPSADEPIEPATEKREEGDVEESIENNEEKPPDSDTVTEEQTGDGIAMVGTGTAAEEEASESAVEDGAENTESALQTQETTAVASVAGEEEASVELANEFDADANDKTDATREDVREEIEKTPSRDDANVAKTQEVLTLVESQLDDVAMEYTQDERFSQAAATKGGDTMESPTQGADDDGDRFSQTQDERFSQTQDDAGATKRTREGEGEEERFSQFTQGSTSMDGPIFEEDGCVRANEDGVDGGNTAAVGNGNCSNSQLLGQTMDTQLSMEY